MPIKSSNPSRFCIVIVHQKTIIKHIRPKFTLLLNSSLTRGGGAPFVWDLWWKDTNLSDWSLYSQRWACVVLSGKFWKPLVNVGSKRLVFLINQQSQK